MGAPGVVVDPLGLLADHLVDVLQRVGADVLAHARVERRPGLELEHGRVFGLLRQRGGGDPAKISETRPTVEKSSKKHRRNFKAP